MTPTEPTENSSLRADVLRHAAQRYGSHPEHLWSSAPNYVILRHTDNQRWYGLIMDIPNAKLSRPGEGRTDILELKCAPAQYDRLLADHVVLPAYHMKKGEWVAVPLDGSVDTETLHALLDMSFQTTASATVARRPHGQPSMPPPYVQTDISYTDEPIQLSPERAKELPPPQYREMRHLAFGSPFTHVNDAKIFHLQAKFMEHFEDDYPYCSENHELSHYYPTYQNLTTAELRGYFSWRTQLRKGTLAPAPRDFALLYLYELLHLIGVKTPEAGLRQLIWFYDGYSAFDPYIQRTARQWIVDFAIYYNQPAEQISAFIDAEFDDALNALLCCDLVDDEKLFPAILRISTHHLGKSRVYKLHLPELKHIVCEGFRRLNERHQKRSHRPFAQRFYGTPVQQRYYPFSSALFHETTPCEHRAYRLTSLQTYTCEHGQWTQNRAVSLPQRNPDVGLFTRTVDRLMRKAFGVKPPLKAGRESKDLIQILTDVIHAQQEAARPKVEFDLGKLSGIRTRSDALGQKLMTDEERDVEPDTPPSPAPETNNLLLPEDERRFLQILLDGGDLPGFLAEKHLMASVLAESVNEHLYDQFADTVIEFDGDRPLLVEDYRNDLKGLLST